ncbi:MAG: SPASM domain-containing protein [Treponema sp.]|nr:SPASM domain-containing protein [Treponema sp.]
MKESRFNIIKKIGSKGYIFNTFSGALAKINEKFFYLLDFCAGGNDIRLLSEEDQILLNNMKEAGFVLEDTIDEVEKLQTLHEFQRQDRRSLSFTIAPTLKCNFSCKYCFEQHTQSIMNEETQEAIVRFLVNEVNNETQEISITWFGGEPLLEKKVIDSISTQVIHFCNKNKIKYKSGIITNGYLADMDTLELFKKIKVDFAQITIDGTKESHNSRRIPKGYAYYNTYDKIIDNINLLLRNNIKVGIRINIDKQNLLYVRDAISELALKLENKQDVFINISYVTISDDSEKIEYATNCLTKEDFAESKINSLILLNNLGFHESVKRNYPTVKFSYCGALGESMYVIDPDGNIYRCWEDIGHLQYKIGDVYKGVSFNLNCKQKWKNYSPFNNEKCRNCTFLPICAGGCPRQSVHFNNTKICETEKHIISKIINFYFNLY